MSFWQATLQDVQREWKGSAVLCHFLVWLFSAFCATCFCRSPLPCQDQTSNTQWTKAWERGVSYQQSMNWVMSWRTGPNWLVFTEVDMEFDCNITVLYCVTHSKIVMCWQQSSKRYPQKCPLFAWGKHHPTRLCITHQTLQSLWDLSSQPLLPFKSEGPLQCCT